MKKSVATWLIVAITISLRVVAEGAAPDGQEEICSSPAVIFCDNFEARGLGPGDLLRPTFKNFGWPASDVANITVVSDPANVFRGSRALQFRYPAGGGGIGFVNPTLGGNYRTVYMRWYAKWSASYTFSPIATKHVMLLTPTGSSLYMFWGQWGTDILKHFAQLGGSTPYEANMTGDFQVARDRWYCLEFRVTTNSSANSSDGYLQGWVDGVQRWEYPNRNLDSFLPNSISSFDVSGYWNCLGPSCDQPADQHPLMYRWHDNFVVSTQRIGCLSGADPTAPPTITGVSPPSGSTAGGTTLDITGTDFTAESTVQIGPNAAAATVNNQNWITAVTPPASIGPADLTVSKSAGTVVLSSAFNYLPPGTELFRDDFATGAADGWRVSPLGNAAGWRVAGGAYTYDGRGHTQSYRGDAFWSDYTLEAKFRLATLDNYPGGIRGRVDETSGAGYSVWLLPATGQIALCRTSGWHIDTPGLTVLATAGGISFDTSAFHTLRVVFTGPLIEVYHDGILVIRISDGAYPSGVVALDVSNEPIAFDDVIVRTLP